MPTLPSSDNKTYVKVGTGSKSLPARVLLLGRPVMRAQIGRFRPQRQAFATETRARASASSTDHPPAGRPMTPQARVGLRHPRMIQVVSLPLSFSANHLREPFSSFALRYFSSILVRIRARERCLEWPTLHPVQPLTSWSPGARPLSERVPLSGTPGRQAGFAYPFRRINSWNGG